MLYSIYAIFSMTCMRLVRGFTIAAFEVGFACRGWCLRRVLVLIRVRRQCKARQLQPGPLLRRGMLRAIRLHR